MAGVATLGSLYFSEVAHFRPCVLCWVQRAFMYPLAPLLFVRGELLRVFPSGPITLRKVRWARDRQRKKKERRQHDCGPVKARSSCA